MMKKFILSLIATLGIATGAQAAVALLLGTKHRLMSATRPPCKMVPSCL